MELTAFLSLVVLLLIVVLPYYAFFFSRAARHTGNLIPGPKPLPIIGSLHAFGHTLEDHFRKAVEFVGTYGFIYKAWIGPYLYVLIADPDFAAPFLTSNVNIKKNINYEFLKPWLGSSLLTLSGSKWKQRRKIITPAFHFKILESFIETFNREGNVLINKLKKHAGGSEFDIYEYINLCALDIICEASMGVKLNVQNKKNCEYVSALHEFSDTFIARSRSPWYFPDFIFNMGPLGRKQKAIVEVLHSMSYKIIEERQKYFIRKERKDEGKNTERGNDVGQKSRLAFLDLLLQYSRDGGNLTFEDIRGEVDTIMFGGHDTVTSGMSFCLWCLAENPDCQQKAYEELCEIFGDSDREVTIEDLTKMKYLECVIKETLRLYPSAPFFFRELVEDVKIGRINFVAGTTVAVSPFLMHRHPKYFPNPEKFDPERFTPESVRGRHPYAYVPFSAGPRNCIGQKFSMLEMKVIISKILRNYGLTSGGSKITIKFGITLSTSDSIYIKLENRK